MSNGVRSTIRFHHIALYAIDHPLPKLYPGNYSDGTNLESGMVHGGRLGWSLVIVKVRRAGQKYHGTCAIVV